MSGAAISDGRFIKQSNESLSGMLDAIQHFKAGSPMYDAFARFRVSQPTTLFESKAVVSEENLLWDIAQVSGAGGSFTYSRDRASVTLKQAATTAGRYVRRTRRHFNYQPGKSQLVIMTCVPGASIDGVHKRLGYFDDNNGVYFGVNGESLFCAIRSNVTGTPVDTIVHQSGWNVDRFDGTGPSGIVINPELVQIFWFDFEWLGAGRVRWGIFYQGIPYVAHEFWHANQTGNTSVYMSTPVLPVSFEIDNDGTGAYAELEAICCTVISEGGIQRGYVSRSVSRGITGQSVTSSNLVPVLSIRARTGFEFSSIGIETIDIIGTANQAFEWQLILNPTIAGTDLAVWTPVTSSTAEFDIARTQENFVTAGIVLDGGYVTAQSRGVVVKPQSFLGIGKPLLPATPKDSYVIACRNVSGNNTYYASATYEEIV